MIACLASQPSFPAYTDGGNECWLVSWRTSHMSEAPCQPCKSFYFFTSTGLCHPHFLGKSLTLPCIFHLSVCLLSLPPFWCISAILDSFGIEKANRPERIALIHSSSNRLLYSFSSSTVGCSGSTGVNSGRAEITANPLFALISTTPCFLFLRKLQNIL